MNSRRVSWASGVHLCQVVPFLSEDSPSQVGLTILSNFQSMESISAFSSSAILKKLSCFGGRNLTNQLQQSVSNITCVCWTCPPNYAVSCDWHVTTGEESQEAGNQKLRELNVLETIYPRVSAIPSSPSVSMDIERESHGVSLTPDIPLVPIEEMENNPDLEPTGPCTLNTETPEVPKQQVPSTAGLDADFLAAASAACAALLKSSEKESMIDPDLLIKIFNDPNLVEQLLNVGGCTALGNVVASNPIPQTLQVPYSSPVCPPDCVANVQPDHPFSSPSPQSVLIPSPGQTVTPSLPFAGGFTRPLDHFGTACASAPIMSSGHLFGPSPSLDTVTQPFEDYPLIPQPIQPAAIQAASISSFATPLPRTHEVLEKVTQPSFPSDNVHRPASNINGKMDTWSIVPKGMIYLKNLIREHGGQKQGKVWPNLISSHQNDSVNLKMGNPLILEQMNYKNNRKTCMFFDSPEGCYSGYNCPFQHDIEPYWDDGRNAKRAKLGLIP